MSTTPAPVAHTPGPLEVVTSDEHHGPYITDAFGCTVADLYTMSKPGEASSRNGGPSRPIHHLYEMADPNARLLAAAYTSYDKHCADPIAAAEGDLLGDALEALAGWDRIHADMIAAGGAASELPTQVIERLATTQMRLMDLTSAILSRPGKLKGGES